MQIIVGTSTPLKFVVRNPPTPQLFFFFFPPSAQYSPLPSRTSHPTHPHLFPSDLHTTSTYSIKIGYSTNVYDNIVLHWQKTHRSKRITLRGCWPGGLLLDAGTTDVITLREDITRANKIMFCHRLASKRFNYETCTGFAHLVPGTGLIQIELSPLEAMSKECTDYESVCPSKNPLLCLKLSTYPLCSSRWENSL